MGNILIHQPAAWGGTLGANGQGMAFLFSDTQIVKDREQMALMGHGYLVVPVGSCENIDP